MTYSAEAADGKKVVVRACSMPGVEDRIRHELEFLRFVAKQECSVCGPVEPGFAVSEDGSTSVTVTEWAQGEPVPWLELKWATDEKQVRAQARWLRELHAASRKFEAENPAVATKVQNWDTLHDGILKGCATPEAPQDASNFGCIHGDLNPSNFFLKANGDLSVFDFDQVHRNWFLFDLAQALFGVFMLVRCGFPMAPASTPAPGIDYERYLGWFVDEYDPKLNQEWLSQALKLKIDFYERFCRRAVKEGNMPADMKPFIEWCVKQFDENKLNI